MSNTVDTTLEEEEEEVFHVEPEVSNTVDTTLEEEKEEVVHVEPEVSNTVDITLEEEEEEVVHVEPEEEVSTFDTDVGNFKQKSYLIILCNNKTGDQINYALDEKSSLYDIYAIDAESVGSKDVNTKWECIRWYLNMRNDWKTYEYIWTPNNNLSISKTDIHEFLIKSKTGDTDITQPSIVKPNDSKIYSHHSLLHREDVTCDVTTSFIENKHPCFKVSFVSKYLKPFLESNKLFLKSGWGIDVWWSNVSKSKCLINTVVIKEVTDSTNKNDNSIGKREMKYYLKKYKLKLSLLT